MRPPFASRLSPLRGPRAPVNTLKPIVGALVEVEIPHLALRRFQFVPVDRFPFLARFGSRFRFRIEEPDGDTDQEAHGQQGRHQSTSMPAAVMRWVISGNGSAPTSKRTAASSAAIPTRIPSASRAKIEAIGSPRSTVCPGDTDTTKPTE